MEIKLIIKYIIIKFWYINVEKFDILISKYNLNC